MPRIRLSIRTMMIVVAIFAASCYGARRYWTYRTWYLWLHSVNVNPFMSSQLSATVNPSAETTAGNPFVVTVKYDFHFTKPKPLPGMTFQIWGGIWIEDSRTKSVVDGYDFVVPLTYGDRESASGEFTWEAVAPRPGNYFLRYELRYGDPLGEWRGTGGAGSSLLVGPPATEPFSE